uniref:Uncharacterized protein n=1 Tax=Anguilla anguilla TaxID=7936 RepID=A0A0E9SVK0_ANGAN
MSPLHGESQNRTANIQIDRKITCTSYLFIVWHMNFSIIIIFFTFFSK